MSSRHAVLLISGFNLRAVVAFCRWATARKVCFHIVAIHESDPIFLTLYKDQVSVVRTSPRLDPGDFCSWVQGLRERHGYDKVLILPSTEFLNRFLLKHRRALEAAGCVVPLVDEALYRTISDKQSFGTVCKSYGLDIPFEFPRMPESLPFVAKPRTYASVGGRQLVPHLIHARDDLERFNALENTSDYYFQQFVEGRNIYLLAYLRERGADILFSQENLMQQSKGASIFLARAACFHTTPTAQRYIHMLHELKFTGLIMIEVKWDEYHDRYLMIEANPRLWGPMQFVVDNGVDLFGALLKDNGFVPETPPAEYSQTSHYFWSGGMTRNAQPFAYHGYSPEQFVQELPLLRSLDIFLRADTLNLFFSQSQDEGQT